MFNHYIYITLRASEFGLVCAAKPYCVGLLDGGNPPAPSEQNTHSPTQKKKEKRMDPQKKRIKLFLL